MGEIDRNSRNSQIDMEIQGSNLWTAIYRDREWEKHTGRPNHDLAPHEPEHRGPACTIPDHSFSSTGTSFGSFASFAKLCSRDADSFSQLDWLFEQFKKTIEKIDFEKKPTRKPRQLSDALIYMNSETKFLTIVFATIQRKKKFCKNCPAFQEPWQAL